MIRSFSARKLMRRLVGAVQSADGFSRTLLELTGDSTQYLVGLVVMGLTNTVLLPLYMRYLSPREFGLYALIEVTALGLMVVSGLGFNVSYLKSFAEDGHSAVTKLLGTMLGCGAVSAALSGVALVILIRGSYGVHIFGREPREFTRLLGLLILFETLETLFHTHLRAQRRPMAISVASVLRLFGIAAFSILFIVVQHRGLTGLFAGRVLGDVVALLANIFCCRRDLGLSFSKSAAGVMLRYGMPLVTIGLMQLSLDGTGRYLVDHYGTLEQVGLYTAGIKVSNLMRILLVAPLGAAWGGLIFQIGRKPNAQFIYSKLLSYILFVAAAVAIAISLLAPTLFLVFSGPAYRGAVVLVPWLLLVQVASIVQCPASVGIYIGNATPWLFPIYGLGVVLELAAGRILVPRYGMFGAAWAWLFGWAVISILTGWIGQRYYRIQFEWKSIAGSLLLLSVVPLTKYLNVTQPSVGSVLFELGGCCAIAGVAMILIVRDVRKSTTLFKNEFAGEVKVAKLAEELG